MYKHFGLTLRDIEGHIPWGEWICLVAVALDEDEKNTYLDVLRAGGKSDEWEWSHTDLALRMNSTRVRGGVRNDAALKDAVDKQISANVERLFGQVKPFRESTVRMKGTAQEAAMAMGHQLVEIEMDPITGQPIIPDGMVFIPYDPDLERTTYDIFTQPPEPDAPAPEPEKPPGGLLGMLNKIA